jgi:hypothetical protein
VILRLLRDRRHQAATFDLVKNGAQKGLGPAFAIAFRAGFVLTARAVGDDGGGVETFKSESRSQL